MLVKSEKTFHDRVHKIVSAYTKAQKITLHVLGVCWLLIRPAGIQKMLMLWQAYFQQFSPKC